jgi:hypothetical protein
MDRVNLAAEMRRTHGIEPTDTEQPAAAEPDSSITPAERQRLVGAERQRALAIIDACALAEQPERAGSFISSGASLGDVVQALGTPRGAGRPLGRA